MKSESTITLDSRKAADFVDALHARRPGYVPEWLPTENGVDAALGQIASSYLQAIVQRLNQAPARNKLAFLDLLGIQLVPAQAARAPMVFRLAENAANIRLPAGTRIAAPPPPERSDQIIFETERSTGLSAAKLTEVFSLWPGRDQYIDHTVAFAAGQPFQPFKKSLLQDTPHRLYLAHDTLLALAGQSTITVDVNLGTVSNEPLTIFWEYWDGMVWREFLLMRPECNEEEAEKYDSTIGLTRNGIFKLATDCAQTAKTIVNGIEAFWIRGWLAKTLPTDPGRVLPKVDSVKMRTRIDRPLTFNVTGPTARPKTESVALRVITRTQGGSPLKNVLALIQDVAPLPEPDLTDDSGEVEFRSERLAKAENFVTVELEDLSLPAAMTSEPARALIADGNATYDLTFTFTGLSPDKAFADAVALDLSKTFYPFGNQPQAGAAFYFTNEEVFSKPGASVTIFEMRAPTVQDKTVKAMAAVTSDILQHLIAWEYWNGTRWITMFQTTENDHPFNSKAGDAGNFLQEFSGFTVPNDMARTKVNNEDGLWMRARLVSGGFGIIRTVTSTTPSFSFVVPQAPAVSDFRFGYSWLGPEAPAEHVLTYNDFQYEDHTDDAKWPGNTFKPFKTVSDATPALYLGFDKKLPEDRLGILFDILEQHADFKGPALVWEYWDGIAWKSFAVGDETRNFRLPGIVSFIGPDDSEALARFDKDLWWLRARLKEDGPPGDPTINAIFPNAAWAIQHQTIVDEPLGASTGQPNQVFAFRQFPVLDNEQIEVREIAGARANVEWRIAALELFGGDRTMLQDAERMLASDGSQTDIQKGDLRLRRDRNKRVTEVWVRWYGRRHFFFFGS